MENVKKSRPSRREALVYGGAGLLSTLPIFSGGMELLGEERKKKRNLIYLWMDGGGPALADFTYPHKTSAEIDVPFNSIQTSNPDLYLTELWPQLATIAKELTVFNARLSETSLDHERAIRHTLGKNVGGGTHFLSRIADQRDRSQFAYAEAPAVIGMNREYRVDFNVNHSLEFPFCRKSRMYLCPSFGDVDQRLPERFKLRNELETSGSIEHLGEHPQVQFMEEYRDSAYRLLSRGKAAALNLQQKDIDRYGKGKSSATTLLPLLAREIIREKIASVVLVRIGNEQTYGSFDQHENLVSRMKELAPTTDHSIAELIRDQIDGVMEEDVLIVCDTEFGRTRQLNNNAGRDHFRLHPSVISGTGFHRGAVIGKPDKYGMCIGGLERGTVIDEEFRKIVEEGLQIMPNRAVRSEYSQVNIFD